MHNRQQKGFRVFKFFLVKAIFSLSSLLPATVVANNCDIVLVYIGQIEKTERTGPVNDFFRGYKRGDITLKPAIANDQTLSLRNVLGAVRSGSGVQPTTAREAKRVNLADPSLRTLSQSRHQQLNPLGPYRMELTRYEEMVAGLRTGDSVTASDGITKVLKEFIGAGNASHVFALSPEKAIKIPFPAGPLLLAKEHPVDVARSYIKKFKEKAEIIKNIPGLDSVVVEVPDDYSYAIVSRVGNGENGATSLEQEKAHAGASSVALHEKNEALRVRVRRLVHGLEHRDLEKDPLEAWEYVAYGREFVYDGKKWILVDWE